MSATGSISRGRVVRIALASALAGLLLLVLAASAGAVSYGMIGRNYETSEVEYAKRSGATVYRIHLDFTCTAGGANWGQFDPIVEAAWQRGMTVLPVLVRSYPSCEKPEHLRYLNSADGSWTAWGEWAKAAAERYGVSGTFWSGKSSPTPITAWEVGNEPNLAQNNPGGTTVQPKAYGEFLKHTSEAIQAGSVAKSGSGTTVLVGGLNLQSGTFAGTFLQEMKNTAYYTGVAIHPYAFASFLEGIEQEVEDVRYNLDNFVSGGTGKSLWVTETGWAVAPASTGFPPGGKAVTEQKQATLLTETFEWLASKATSYQIPLITWYKLQDQTETGTHWDEHTGLRRIDGSFRPAWAAFQAQAGVPTPRWEGPPEVLEDNDFNGPRPVAAYDGSVDTFWRTPSGGLEYSTWSPYTGNVQTTIAGELASAPHVYTQENGSIDVFWRTPANKLGHAWRQGLTGSWSSGTIAGELDSDPHAIVQDSGAIDVFWKTPTGNLGHYWFRPGVGGSSETETASVASDPIPAVQPNGTYDVFWRTAANTLGHFWYVPGNAPGMETITGVELSSDPAVGAQPSGVVDVFWRTPSATLGHYWFIPGVGGSKGTVGETELASEPHLVEQSDGWVDVFWKTPANKLGHYWFVPGLGGKSATVAGSELASDPYPVFQRNGTYDVFWRTPANKLGHYWYERGGEDHINTVSVEMASPPHAVAQSNGIVDVFWRTPTAELGHWWYLPGPTGESKATTSASIAAALTPTATTEAATTGTKSATLKGKVNPRGSNTTYKFEYGKTTSYGTSVPATATFVGGGTVALPVSQAISGLETGVTYHYRVVATSEAGTTVGSDVTFKP